MQLSRLALILCQARPELITGACRSLSCYETDYECRNGCDGDTTCIYQCTSFVSIAVGILFLNLALKVTENTCRSLLESDFGCFWTGNKSTFSDFSGHRVIFQKRAPYSCSQTDFWRFETLTMFIQLSVYAACHAKHHGI